MQERFFNYGEKRNVTVVSSNKNIIACHDENMEGFILMFHGLTDLPKVGDQGTIVFERDNKRGHWQYYPKQQSPLKTLK